MVCRAPVRLEGAAWLEGAGWLDALLDAPRDARTGAVVPGHVRSAGDAAAHAGDEVFATTRAVLRRVAALPDADDGGDLDAVLRRLGLSIGVAAAVTAALASPPPAQALAPDRHARRVAASRLFDDAFYRARVPEAGADALGHYCREGWRAGRAPNAYFDPAHYRRAHMRSGADEDPLLHYLRHRRDGVRPSPWFDPAFVRWSLHLAPDEDPLACFLARRAHEDVSPVPGFDAARYRAARPDLRYRGADPFGHYLEHGQAEGTDPSAWFDSSFYRARMMMPARRGARANPLLDWLARRDEPGMMVSWRDAIDAAHGRVAARGGDAIELDFVWCDGLPQDVGALRAVLAAPATTALRFIPVLRNEALASRPLLASGAAARLRAPYDDELDDPDIRARLAECFADPRQLTSDGAVVLGVAPGAQTERAMRWAARLAAGHAAPVVLRLARGGDARP